MGRRAGPSAAALLKLLDDRRRDEDQKLPAILPLVGRLEEPAQDRNLPETGNKLSVDRLFVGVDTTDDGSVTIGDHDGCPGFLNLDCRQVVDCRTEIRSILGHLDVQEDGSVCRDLRSHLQKQDGFDELHIRAAE